MKYRIIIILIALTSTISCSKDKKNTFSSLEGLSDYEIDVIEYFKAVEIEKSIFRIHLKQITPLKG